jgi:hypothetical protein
LQQGRQVKDQQPELFENEKAWKEHWQGMPEFVQPSKESIKQIVVHFETFEDVKKFADLIGIKISVDTKSFFYPPKKQSDSMVYVDES